MKSMLTIASACALICGSLPSFASDTNLSDAVQRVLTNNPQVYGAVQQYQSTTFERDAAKAGWRPQVELGLGVGYQELKSPSTANITEKNDTSEASLRVYQTLWDGSATKNEVARQTQRMNSAKHGAVATAENLTLRTAEVYIEVLKHHELTELAKQSLDRHAQIRRQMQARSNAGVGSDGDLSQIKAREALAHSNYVASKSALLNAETNYLRVVGNYPVITRMQEPKSLIDWFSDDPQKEIESALREHPTLKAATADVRSAQAQYSASKSAFMPTVQLEAMQSYDKNINGVAGTYDDTVVGLRFSYDIYAGGKHSAQKKYSARQIEVAKAVRDNTHLQVIESIRLSLNAFQTLSERESYLRNHVDYALASRNAYREQFKIGKRTLLDVLNTENEYVNAAQALAAAEHDHLFSQYRIVHAKGQLLTALNFDTAALTAE